MFQLFGYHKEAVRCPSVLAYERRNSVNFTHAATDKCDEATIAAEMKEYHTCGEDVRNSLITELNSSGVGAVVAGGADGLRQERKRILCSHIEELLGSCFQM